ncbi:uncharacterized protein LOC124550864 isoform X1 [Schistocerca americana]|uniref:uncharacterized protein LOC124550864 isoform X1 n=1 Tax=Schistocerca americana TaxID=7009 RepID=UPI001F4F2202|nr:uncharacterized protein LOC124550864 isoform X1 [Schistocerca americana]
MLFHNNLDMIGRNEPITRKAKFWQSYVRALKGTDDMRAPDRVSHRPRGLFRPLFSDFPDLPGAPWLSPKSIYDEPSHAAERISTPGYRYLPVSRETYGYSPRNLYPLPSDRYRPGPWSSPKALSDYLDRMWALDKLYPLRGPSPATVRSTPAREYTPTPEGGKTLGYNYAGQPIYSRGGSLVRRPLSELFEPLTTLPLSRITRDPWWWDYPHLRPYESPYNWLWPKTPFYLRDSYLSPVKRTYLWYKHPIRPFDWPLYTPSGALYRRPLSVMIDPFTIEPLSWDRRDPLLDPYPQIGAKYRRPEAWEYPRHRLHTPLLWDYPALRPHGQSYGYLWAKSRSWLSDWYNF